MRDGRRLERIAEALLVACENGDVAALRELGDRIEGKVVPQSGNSGIRILVVRDSGPNALITLESERVEDEEDDDEVGDSNSQPLTIADKVGADSKDGA